MGDWAREFQEFKKDNYVKSTLSDDSEDTSYVSFFPENPEEEETKKEKEDWQEKLNEMKTSDKYAHGKKMDSP
jgi:hypothetical protein